MLRGSSAISQGFEPRQLFEALCKEHVPCIEYRKGLLDMESCDDYGNEVATLIVTKQVRRYQSAEALLLTLAVMHPRVGPLYQQAPEIAEDECFAHAHEMARLFLSPSISGI